MRPSRSSSTWAAVVGLMRLKVLALGAATGTPALGTGGSGDVHEAGVVADEESAAL